MPRILYVSDGCSTHDCRFLAAIAAGNHAVHHLPLRLFAPPLQSSCAPCATLPPLAPDFSPDNPQTWDAARRRLQEILRDLQPDAIVAGPATTCGFLVAWARAYPLMLTLWGWDILVAPNEGAKTRRMVEYALRRADLILCDCQSVKRRCIELVGRSSTSPDDDRFIILPYGIELDRFSTADPGRALRERLGWNSNRILIHTRSFEPRYGVLEFLRAFAELATSRPAPTAAQSPQSAGSPEPAQSKIQIPNSKIEPQSGVPASQSKIENQKSNISAQFAIRNPQSAITPPFPDLRAIVIGDGPLRDDVHATVRGLGLEGLVHLPGRVPEADLPDWFHAADIYVSAAHSDGTSISLLEAMAAGLPVITSDAPGNREWVTPGDNGWLHHAGDAADLAETIALALAADTRLMSRANLAQVRRRADWTRNAQKLRDAIDRLVRP